METKKKTWIILASVAAVCLLGLAVSQFAGWNVDSGSTGGNIGKSSRFSRKTAKDGASNMQELLLNDEDYKDGILSAYLVMKTRAQDFSALVDMSAEVAGDIPDFEGVLKDMKDVQPMVDNVCVSLETAGNDINAALDGEVPKDLAQNTTNAVLAYSTLQKQNSLATRFIETADSYLETAGGDDRLKFVRDQWLDYQQMTAALAQDEEASAALEAKGYRLSPDKGAATLNSFGETCQMAILCNAALTEVMGLTAHLRAVNYVDLPMANAMVVRNAEALSEQASEVLGNASKTLQNGTNDVLGNASKTLQNQTDEVLGNVSKTLQSQTDTKALGNGAIVLGNGALVGMSPELVLLSSVSGLENVQNAAAHIVVKNAADLGQIAVISNQMNDVLGALVGESAESLRFF